MIRRLLLLYVIMASSIVSLNATVLDDAITEFNNGNYETVIPMLLQQVDKSKNNGNLLQMLAVAYYKTGNKVDAQKYFELARKRNIPESLVYLAQIKFDNYEFDEASALMSEYETSIKKTKKTVSDEARDMNARIGRARDMFDHVEKLVIIDSISVDKDEFFKAYKLSVDAGVIGAGEVLPIKDIKTQSAYLSANGDVTMWSENDDSGILRLKQASKLLDGTWDEAIQLDDKINDEGDANYPYLMPDGQTLYYAANGKNSIGGYDIFVTRKDDETGEFLQPQNLGMPINSPYDDYMLVIDETNGVGWWATDRNQIPGKVTIYIYKTPESRVNYESGMEGLKHFAAIDNYKATWPEGVDYRDFVSSLVQDPNGNGKVEYEFTFYVQKDVVYHYINDFKTPEGEKLMQQYLSVTKLQNENIAKQKDLRLKYHKASATERKAMENELLQFEKNISKRNEEISYIANSIRRVEGNARK